MSAPDLLVPLHSDSGGLLPRGTRAEVFQEIFVVFLVLGTLVGIVVVGYTLYTAYRYRDGEDADHPDGFDPPAVGELPTGGGGGRKLFLSFTLSTIIVVSLIAWTYGTLLYVEADSPADTEDALEVEVVGTQFAWTFVYPNGHETTTLRVPADRPVQLHVTSDDVFHTFGIPDHRVKTDAIPGRYTDTWFTAEEPGTYEARCYELCGAGHSQMTADVVVMEPGEYDAWYAETNETTTTAESATATTETTAGPDTTTASTATPTGDTTTAALSVVSGRA